MSRSGPPNRLARETSPYLLQHAHNPVDWYPWGDEAFAHARRRACPIFLSIGYSTCYWCHVMERECFESETIAAQMNRDFVCIKVDREERPDLDDIYMAATQMTTGRGGWPMSVFLEPEKLMPFYCGTYFPPEERTGMRSFPQVLSAIAVAWKERRDQVLEQSRTLAGAVSEHLGGVPAATTVGLAQVSSAAQTLLRMLDRAHGGFGAAPKFPQPVFLELMLDVREAAADEPTRTAADEAIRLTLDRMSCGGIHDQVGGGFHRYSVDELWLVPHFEKMLYDNAQLANVYARSAALYKDEVYGRTAKRTLDYILRELAQDSGAFSSAQDAEVDGREGANYLWTREQLSEALGEPDSSFAQKVYGLDHGTNFRDPHHPDEPMSNVLFLDGRPDQLAPHFRLESAEFEARLDAVNAALYHHRAKRRQPRLDDKVITAWNGLAIAALARAAVWLNEPRYATAAAKAAAFILGSMRDDRGQLLRTSRAGSARTPAFLEDYAFLIDGLLALHSAQGPLGSSPVPDPLAIAMHLAAQASELFGAPGGGFFDTRAGQADLFIRSRSTHDGAIPSGASVMLANLLELHERTGRREYLESAKASLASLSGAMADSPVGAANAVRSLLKLVSMGAVPDAGTEEPPAARRFTPVEIFATEDRLQVGKDKPASLHLVLKVADGYHINAARPGDGNLVPLRIGVINGSGIAAYADYPEGEAYGESGQVRIHRGEVGLDIAIERSGEWSGRPLLAVTFQACTETECLRPMTAELDVAIDPID